jgi:hypothetical protein
MPVMISTTTPASKSSLTITILLVKKFLSLLYLSGVVGGVLCHAFQIHSSMILLSLLRPCLPKFTLLRLMLTKMYATQNCPFTVLMPGV